MSNKFNADDYKEIINILKGKKEGVMCDVLEKEISDALTYAADSNILLKKQIQAMDDVIEIQCSDGNWNCDSYMHGMANGMIMMRSMFSSKKPEFLDKPKKGYIEENCGGGGSKCCEEIVSITQKEIHGTFIPGDI